MERLLIITGPTATGKTALAVALAKKFNGEIISADSRQVYRFMNFGTGKDLPKNAKFFDQNSKFGHRNPSHNYGFYLFDDVPVWGLDVVDPDFSFNVSDFVEYSRAVITDITKRGRLPIVVGGTGLYLRGILGEIDTIGTIFDEKLRKELAGLSVEALQERLLQTGGDRFQAMNPSDQKNPRRLVRAIEMTETADIPNAISPINSKNSLLVVLHAPLGFISEKISRRDRGEILAEMKTLLNQDLSFSLPSMTGLGYKAFRPSIERVGVENLTDKDVKEALTLWNQEDRQYAKRQLTFFKKFFPETKKGSPKTVWADITSQSWQDKVQSVISKWYTDSTTD